MAEPASARGDFEPADDKRRNPRQRRDHHDTRETAIHRETRLSVRGSSRGRVVRETTPTRDRVRL